MSIKSSAPRVQLNAWDNLRFNLIHNSWENLSPDTSHCDKTFYTKGLFKWVILF